MDHTIEEIEDLRLKELRKQAATYGPQTDPAVLIEIQELSRGHRSYTRVERRQLVNNLDYDFLMNVVAAALVRLGKLEAVERKRQIIQTIWMVVIGVICIANLMLLLAQR